MPTRVALRRVNVGKWDNAAARQATTEFRLEALPYVRVYDARGKFVDDVTGGSWDQFLKVLEKAQARGRRDLRSARDLPFRVSAPDVRGRARRLRLTRLSQPQSLRRRDRATTSSSPRRGAQPRGGVRHVPDVSRRVVSRRRARVRVDDHPRPPASRAAEPLPHRPLGRIRLDRERALSRSAPVRRQGPAHLLPHARRTSRSIRPMATSTTGPRRLAGIGDGELDVAFAAGRDWSWARGSRFRSDEPSRIRSTSVGAGLKHEHIQFGSGTFDPTLAVQWSRPFGKVRLGASVDARIPLYENRPRFPAPATVRWAVGPRSRSDRPVSPRSSPANTRRSGSGTATGRGNRLPQRRSRSCGRLSFSGKAGGSRPVSTGRSTRTASPTSRSGRERPGRSS